MSLEFVSLKQSRFTLSSITDHKGCVYILRCNPFITSASSKNNTHNKNQNMERSWLKEIVPKIQENFFLFISASWVFMLASVSDFYLHITFKKREVIPYTTCYITFQLLVRIDRVNKLNVSYLQIYRYTLLLIPHLKTGILNINTKLKARWAKTNQRALTERRH